MEKHLSDDLKQLHYSDGLNQVAFGMATTQLVWNKLHSVLGLAEFFKVKSWVKFTVLFYPAIFFIL